MTSISANRSLERSATIQDKKEHRFSQESVQEVMSGIYARGDRLMKRFLLFHFLLALVFAPIYGTWLVTLAVGAAAVGMFFASAALLPGAFLTRCVAGIALQMFVALHIYQLHGLPEMHFFFFTTFTMMIVYQDGKCMWPGAFLIIAQHTAFAILTYRGIELSYFGRDEVDIQKFVFHFGIALGQVGICSYWAVLLRQQTLREAYQQAQLSRNQALLEKQLQQVQQSEEELQSQTEELTRAKEALSAAYESEKRVAETLQRSLLLTAPEDRFPGLAVKTFYEAAVSDTLVGGDFYDTFALDERRVALVVGDVSGKGISAAADTAEIKYALRAFLRDDPDTARALCRLNDFVCYAQRFDGRSPTSLVALALAVVDTATGEVTVSSAGAEPPLLLCSDGKSEEVDIRGLLLGVQPGEAYDTVIVHLGVGDVMMMLTDGLTEARGRDRALLGYDGLARMAVRFLPTRSLQEMGRAILGSARAFAGGSLQDDACLLIARRH